MPRPRARLCAASRAEATLIPAVASETNTMYTAKISWYRPMPSAAQVGRQHHPEAHAQHPQHQPAGGEQGGVLQIGLAPCHGIPLPTGGRSPLHHYAVRVAVMQFNYLQNR